MTLKLIDLFEIKYLGINNKDSREIINKLEVHEILNLDKNIRNQFVLMISTFFKDMVVIHIFKKYFNRDKMWSINKLQYLNSFCLTKKIDNKINWKNLDKRIDILDPNFFLIDDNYERSILTDDYDFYMEIKGNFQNFTPENEQVLEKKVWGKNFHFNDIKWQVILSNCVTTLYGSGIEDINFRTKDFKFGNLLKIYFQNYDEKSLVFEKFFNNKIVYCEVCHLSYKIMGNKFYNHPNFGDMCQCCFKLKKAKEDYRKQYFIRYIHSIGRSKLFKQELEKTKKYLEENPIIELSYDKKYQLMIKINKNINKERKRNVCSVCLEEMTDDIYAGSCGHCLHGSCYFRLANSQCPVCRKVGSFKKLHL